VFPVKTRQAKPLYLTFACLRLLTVPTGRLPSFLLCTSARGIVPNDIGHVGRQGPVLPAISCGHRNLPTLVFLSRPSYFSLHRRGLVQYYHFRSEDYWACIANPAGVFGCCTCFARAQWICSRQRCSRLRFLVWTARRLLVSSQSLSFLTLDGVLT